MKEQIKSTRNLIKNNKIKDAIILIENYIPRNLENDLLLLSASFNKWEKDNLIGLAPPIEQRNKSIYGILELVSEVELINQDVNNRNLSFKQKIERNLKIGYGLIYDLKTNEINKTELIKRLGIDSSSSKENQIEKLIHELIEKNEKIYTLIKSNFVLSIISIFSPIILGSLDILEELVDSLEDTENQDEDNDIDIE